MSESPQEKLVNFVSIPRQAVSAKNPTFGFGKTVICLVSRVTPQVTESLRVTLYTPGSGYVYTLGPSQGYSVVEYKLSQLPKL